MDAAAGDTEDSFGGDTRSRRDISGGRSIGYSASLAYYRQIIAGLAGTAAVGIDGIKQPSLPDIVSASALAGLRYSF